MAATYPAGSRANRQRNRTPCADLLAAVCAAAPNLRRCCYNERLGTQRAATPTVTALVGTVLDTNPPAAGTESPPAAATCIPRRSFAGTNETPRKGSSNSASFRPLRLRASPRADRRDLSARRPTVWSACGSETRENSLAYEWRRNRRHPDPHGRASKFAAMLAAHTGTTALELYRRSVGSGRITELSRKAVSADCRPRCSGSAGRVVFPARRRAASSNRNSRPRGCLR